MRITLKALRVNKDIGQTEAAKALSVSIKTLQNWEKYITFPTGPQLVKICRLYGCDLDDIFFPEELAKSEDAEE